MDGFFDIYSVQPGDNIPARISSGLEDCDVYIPVLSASAFDSPWCEWEINTAIQLHNTRERHGRPRIIPVIIDQCQDKIPTILRPGTSIDFSGNPYAISLQNLLVGMQQSIPATDRPYVETSSSRKRAPEPSRGSWRKPWAKLGIGGAILGLILLAALVFTDNNSLGWAIEFSKDQLMLTTVPPTPIASPIPSPTAIPITPALVDNPLCSDSQYTSFSFPKNGSQVSGAVEVRGKVIPKPYTQPYQYSLFYRPGIVRQAVDAVSESQIPVTLNLPIGNNYLIHFKFFQPSDPAIETGVLGIWNTNALASGWYSLRIWFKDRGNANMVCDVYVYVTGL